MQNLRLLIAMFTLLATAATPRPAAATDVVPGRALLGTWHCTYMAGGHATMYSATFAHAMGGIWMHETDSAHGAPQGEALYTYDSKSKTWTAVFVGSDRTATVFRAVGPSTTHIVYHSVYPDRSMSETFDWPAPRKYTLHFTQVAGGKTIRSNDICTKT